MKTVEFDNQVKEQIKLLQAEVERLFSEVSPKLDKIGVLRDVMTLIKKGIPPEQIQDALRIQGKSIPDLAEEVLRDAGIPLHYTAIMREIESKYKIAIPGKNPKANMNAHLHKSRFVRVGRSVYGLIKKHGIY